MYMYNNIIMHVQPVIAIICDIVEKQNYNSTSLTIVLFSSGCGGGGGETVEREFRLLLCRDIVILALPIFFSSSLSSRLLALYFPSSVLCRLKVHGELTHTTP